MNCDLVKVYQSSTVFFWSWLALGRDPAGCSVQAGLNGQDQREISAVVVASIITYVSICQIKLPFASKFCHWNAKKKSKKSIIAVY